MGGVVSVRAGVRSGVRSGVRAGFNPSLGGGGGTIAATLNTLDLDPQVATDDTPWDATLTWNTLGAGGNDGVLSLTFHDGDPAEVEVRDNETYETGSWAPAPGTIGVRCRGTSGVDVPTIDAIETAINTTSTLAQITSNDPAPDKSIDMTELEGLTATGSFTGGA
jgi:hypothetical protein